MGYNRSEVERLDPCWSLSCSREQWEQPRQNFPCLRQITVYLPERPQCLSQTETRPPVAELCCPTQRSPQVIVLPLQPLQPHDLFGSAKPRLSLLGQRQEPVTVLPSYGF